MQNEIETHSAKRHSNRAPGTSSAKDLETFETAVRYQMFHALGLILIGLLAAGRPDAILNAAGWTMFAGILLFSGFLYAYVATGRTVFAMFVPVGGLAFILAWLGVAIAAMRRMP
jgi:uncharacterized membrane protein YgdD (TMEM256/DUF423 family)